MSHSICRTVSQLTVALLAGMLLPRGAGAVASFEVLNGVAAGSAFFAQDVSADGSVVAGFYGSSAAIWVDGVTTVLVPPCCSFNNAQAASADGAVIAGHSWRWENGSFTRVLGPNGSPVLQTSGSNADGSVLVGTFASTTQYFRWENGVSVGIDPPAGLTPLGPPVVSADGSVIAATGRLAGDDFAFRWDDGVGEVLPRLSATLDSSVKGISADGRVIVGESGDDAYLDYRPVYWLDGEIEVLPGLGTDVLGTAHDASADGSIIVGTSRAAGTRATLWFDGEPHGLYTMLFSRGLPISGWALDSAIAVSDDGHTIVGIGRNPSGVQRHWIAHLDACWDGLDDDRDGLTDFPDDPGCSGNTDETERSDALPCDDGADNDGDGLADLDDPACQTPTSPVENPKCDDDLDNDGDGGVDWDGGADAGTPDPECVGKPWRAREGANACGLGAELALALVLLATGRRRILR
ncbi:MAG: hypothetical protein DCC71_12000 [Proteobacteria bacterium]|nr:MAG: hypothetical protein DCC71_12000 [Pseudomonadota bacterium]